MKDKVLVYGATGYTGKLFARFMVEKGQSPILAGRRDNIVPVGKELGCETRIFSVDAVGDALKDVNVLVNAAGPFAKTQKGLIQACIDSGTHYLDIAGEVPEMETAYSFQEAAEKAGVLVIPAAGFGVLPTDMAARLASEAMPDATHLRIAFATQGGASRGTLKTVLKDIAKPGIVVREGKAETAMPGTSTHTFQAGGKSFKTVYNPWRADLFTAQHSTGIPNIETYSNFPGFVVRMMKGKLGWLRNLMLNRLINWLPEGPSDKQLKKGKTFVQAEVRNANGRAKTVTILGPEAYQFTVESLWQIAQNIQNGTDHRGVKPPSVFGREVIEGIPGVSIQ